MGKLVRALLLAVVPFAAQADLTGRVVNVADGDTLTLLVERKQVKVRLDAIDAPERAQPCGRRSQQSLAELCVKRNARVVTKGVDRYGRIIGVVVCDGVDANSEQVRRGMAWVFERYAPAGSPLYGLQREAQATRRGLWADPGPVAPWAYRAKPRRG
jgi:endonuclease YncB( thermonuclease family)